MTIEDRKELLIAMSLRNMIFDDNLYYRSEKLLNMN